MTERLLSVDDGPEGYQGVWIGKAKVTTVAPGLAAEARAELDRLYAAAEANQAPGPDWKAKLRREVESEHGREHTPRWNDALKWVLSVIDALPDPPTPDPDAPPVYVPPEGHVAPVLGENVPDGWEGHYVCESGYWWDARTCRAEPNVLFEVRRVPAPEPATEWVPVHEALATERVADSPGVGPFVVARVVRAPDGPVLAMSADGSRYVHVREDGMVLVLAEGER